MAAQVDYDIDPNSVSPNFLVNIYVNGSTVYTGTFPTQAAAQVCVNSFLALGTPAYGGTGTAGSVGATDTETVDSSFIANDTQNTDVVASTDSEAISQ